MIKAPPITSHLARSADLFAPLGPVCRALVAKRVTWSITRSVACTPASPLPQRTLIR
jgi:hypothetical protein